MVAIDPQASEEVRRRIIARFGSLESQIRHNRRLVQALGRRGYVLFLGAGIPAAVGYPGWEDLVEGVRQEVRYPTHLQLLTPLEQAQILWNHFVKNVYRARPINDATQMAAAELAFNQIIIKVLSGLRRASDPPEWFHLLRRLMPPEIVTTNVDATIEEHLLDGLVNVFRFRDGRKPLSSPGFSNVYKIHGDMNDARNLVFTEIQYNRWERDDPYLSAKLTVLFSEQPTIALGYSFRDPDVQLRHFEAFSRFFDSVEPVYLLLDPGLYPENQWQVLRERGDYFESKNVVLLFGALEEFLSLGLAIGQEYQDSTQSLIDQMGPVRESVMEWAKKASASPFANNSERLGEPTPERAEILLQSLTLVGESEEVRIEVGLPNGAELEHNLGLALLRDVLFLLVRIGHVPESHLLERIAAVLARFTTKDSGAWNFDQHPTRFRLFLDALQLFQSSKWLSAGVQRVLSSALAEHVLFAGPNLGDCWASGTILSTRLESIPVPMLQPLLDELAEGGTWEHRKAFIGRALTSESNLRSAQRIRTLSKHSRFAQAMS